MTDSQVARRLGWGRAWLAAAVALPIAALVVAGATVPVHAAVDDHVDVLFDGTRETFDRWQHVGAGSFELGGDGTMRTVGGLGMLWYPVREYGDYVLRFEWRDTSGDGAGNGGAFIRFPDPEAGSADAVTQLEACRLGVGSAGTAWVAIACGHEIQINDWQDSDSQKSGSVYNFAPNDADAARRTDKGAWNTYEIRVEGAGDYSVTVVRNGQVIQEWQNTPGQTSSRPTDPPTDLRQFATGYIGLQNHGEADVIDYRNVTIEDLSAAPEDPGPAPSEPADPPPAPPMPVTGGVLVAVPIAGLLIGLWLQRRP